MEHRANVSAVKKSRNEYVLGKKELISSQGRVKEVPRGGQQPCLVIAVN